MTRRSPACAKRARRFITEGTVKGHVNHIPARMSVADRTQAILAGLKRGLVEPG